MRPDPFRSLLISALESGGHTDWANKEKSAQRIETARYSGPRMGITSIMLLAQKQRLREVKSVSVPQAKNIEIIRSGSFTTHSGAEFADFVQQTRRDLTILAGTQTGQDIFSRIDSSGHKVLIQDRGNNRRHGGSIKIHNEQNAYQTDGPLIPVPNKGSSSTVTHQPDRTKLDLRKDSAGSSSAIGLGHELIHAVHSATGTLLKGKDSDGMKREERATTGPISGSKPHWGLPTENALRRDMTQHYAGGTMVKSIPARTKYGKRNV